MHTMEVVSAIQQVAHEKKMSYREIQQELGVGAQTISKALNRPEEFVEGCRREKPVERRALGKFVKKIEELLTGKEWARKWKGRRARRTARWVYKQIKKEGRKGGQPSSFRRMWRARYSLISWCRGTG